MSWDLLKTDYQDAAFEGMRKYIMLNNSDGTVSFVDVTSYTVKEEAFFGADDANKINTAVNAILAALEKGTDLYEVFSNFFKDQEMLFASAVAAYCARHEEAFGTWFDAIKGKLGTDVAGDLQNQINEMKFYFVLENTLYLPQTSASASDGVLMLGMIEQEATDEY